MCPVFLSEYRHAHLNQQNASHEKVHDVVLYNVTASVLSMHLSALVAYEVQKEMKCTKVYSLPMLEFNTFSQRKI